MTTCARCRSLCGVIEIARGVVETTFIKVIIAFILRAHPPPDLPCARGGFMIRKRFYIKNERYSFVRFGWEQYDDGVSEGFK